jgi:hypothetical protein
MRMRSLLVMAISIGLWVMGWLYTPPAHALTQIKVSDLSYEACPSEFDGMVTPGGASRAANCFLIKGTAENPSGKAVYDADVFGRVYDANGNPVMQNRTRLGSIDEVPPGKSPFEIRISVAANQPTPLKLEQFKASGFTSRVR